MSKKQWKIKLVSVGKFEWYMHRFFSWVVGVIKKYRLDGEELLLPGKYVERAFTSEREKADKKLLRKIDKLITAERRILKKHFEDPKQGWDLDLHFIREQIINDAVGFNMTDYIVGRLVRKREIDLLYTSGKSYLVKRKK